MCYYAVTTYNDAATTKYTPLSSSYDEAEAVPVGLSTVAVVPCRLSHLVILVLEQRQPVLYQATDARISAHR